MKAVIPKWIIVYLWFVTIMTIIYTIIGYVMPDVHYIAGQNLGEGDPWTGPLSLYLSRNIAIILVYLFALYDRRLKVLKTVFILRGVVDLMDFLQDALSGNMIAMIIPLAMCLIDIYALIKLYSLKK